MLKTLKITSIVAAIVCAVLVILIVGFGLKGDPKIEKILALPSIIQELKKIPVKTVTSDLLSPVVKEAKAFALRIDPPPPPKKPAPEKKEPTERPVAKKPEIREPKVSVSTGGKIQLIATCRYENNPRNSLALLDLPAKGQQWFRVGDKVEHLVVEEVNDGSVVFTQGGTQSSVLMKEVPSRIRSLIPGEGGERPVAGATNTTISGLGVGNAYISPEGGNRKAPSYVSPNRGAKPVGSAVYNPAGRTATRKPRTYAPPSLSRSRKMPPKQTIEQRKAVLDDNISDIRQIIKQPTSVKGPDAKAEQEALAKLLELLQNERQNADSDSKKDVTESDKKKEVE